MSYTVANLKSELTGVLHGTSLSRVQGLDVLIDRAARKLVNEVDILETQRIVSISNGLFQDIYDYPAPADVKGDRVIDIRPQINRTQSGKFFQTYQEQFDLNKEEVFNKGSFTIQYRDGVKSLRISKEVLNAIKINQAQNITDNGTWAVGDDATNLSVDNINYVSGSGSLRFDTTGAGTTAYLENSTMTAVDLSRDLNQGSLFCWVYIPDPTIVTNWILRWGNDTSNYWSNTVTTAFDSTAFQTGWNLLKFDWNGATTTGSPVSTSVDYLRITLTYDGTIDNDFRINAFVSNLSKIYDILYYSKYLFRDATTNAFQERVTADTNIINLDTDAYNLLFNLVAYFCAQQIQGKNSSFDAQLFLSEYNNEKKRYIAKNKAQIRKPMQSYYTMPNQTRATRIRYSSS
jgi:hypothetical protein